MRHFCFYATLLALELLLTLTIVESAREDTYRWLLSFSRSGECGQLECHADPDGGAEAPNQPFGRDAGKDGTVIFDIIAALISGRGLSNSTRFMVLG